MTKFKFLTTVFLMLTLPCLFAIAGKTKWSDTTEKNKMDNLPIFLMSEAPETHITIEGAGEFYIKIKSHIATGYSWEFDRPPDESKIKFLGKIGEDEGASSKEKLLGAPGFELWKFRALKAGQTSIFLKFIRPWEKDVAPAGKHKINLTVRF